MRNMLDKGNIREDSRTSWTIAVVLSTGSTVTSENVNRVCRQPSRNSDEPPIWNPQMVNAVAVTLPFMERTVCPDRELYIECL